VIPIDARHAQLIVGSSANDPRNCRSMIASANDSIVVVGIPAVVIVEISVAVVVDGIA